MFRRARTRKRQYKRTNRSRKRAEHQPPEPDQHQIDLLKESTARLEEEIKVMKESVAWQWDLAKGNNKIAIVKNYMIYLSRVYKDKI